MSGPALYNSRKNGIELMGPLANFVTPQDVLPDGITQSLFQIDAKKQYRQLSKRTGRNPSRASEQ